MQEIRDIQGIEKEKYVNKIIINHLPRDYFFLFDFFFDFFLLDFFFVAFFLVDFFFVDFFLEAFFFFTTIFSPHFNFDLRYNTTYINVCLIYEKKCCFCKKIFQFWNVFCKNLGKQIGNYLQKNFGKKIKADVSKSGFWHENNWAAINAVAGARTRVVSLGSSYPTIVQS